MESGRRPLSTEELAFYRAIWEAPDDDAPKLIFADWLDEHDEPNHAEYIRQAVTYCRVAHTKCVAASKWRITVNDPVYYRLVRRDTTNIQEGNLELLEYGPNVPAIPSDQYSSGIAMVCGFVRYVYCPLYVWRVNYGPQLAHHPVELRITDRIPYRAVDQSTNVGRPVFWTFQQLGERHSSNLPGSLRPYLIEVGGYFKTHTTPSPMQGTIRYETPNRAMKALGEALVLEARDTHVLTRPTSSPPSLTPDTESVPG